MPALVARIDLAALQANYQTAHKLSPASRNFAVIKADAYGHGSVKCAMALDCADGFAVATPEEGVELRRENIDKPVLILSRFCQPGDVRVLQRYKLSPVVHSQYQLDILIDNHNGLQPIDIWVKIDTGMNRLGLDSGELPAIVKRIGDARCINAVGLMTHLACADETDNDFTNLQLQRFQQASALTCLPLSIANSAAILAWPSARQDWNRPGLMLYGVSPFATGGKPGAKTVYAESADVQLRPVMSLTSKLISVATLRKGEGIGYGQTFIADKNLKVGIVACGYADGYPRHAGTGTPVLVCNRVSRLLGRVSMDTLAVDLSTVPEAEVGSPVQLWGTKIPVAEIARHAGTIAYELLTGVSQRVPRQYVS